MKQLTFLSVQKKLKVEIELSKNNFEKFGKYTFLSLNLLIEVSNELIYLMNSDLILLSLNIIYIKYYYEKATAYLYFQKQIWGKLLMLEVWCHYIRFEKIIALFTGSCIDWRWNETII